MSVLSCVPRIDPLYCSNTLQRQACSDHTLASSSHAFTPLSFILHSPTQRTRAPHSTPCRYKQRHYYSRKAANASATTDSQDVDLTVAAEAINLRVPAIATAPHAKHHHQVSPTPAPCLAPTIKPTGPAAPIPAAPAVTAAPARPAAAPAALTAARFDAAYLNNPSPAYPMLSRRLREEGEVMLRVLVAADGQPKRIEVRTGSGSERLDRAAEDAVARWRFVPARRGESAVEAWVLVPIVFKLKGN